MKKWFIRILVLVMIAVTLTACGEKKIRVDLSDYADVLFRGSDGDGTARGDFDYVGFERAVMEGAEPDSSGLGSIVRVESALSVTVSPDSGLKNGDRVTVTVSYDRDIAGEAGLKITGNSKTMTVEGLKAGAASGENGTVDGQDALIELDAFDPAYWNTPDGITVSYEGISPYGTVGVINHLPADNPLSSVGYQFSELRKVYEGDSVSVTAYFTKNDMKNQYRFKEESGTCTIGAVDHYLMNGGELDAGTISAIKQAAVNLAAQNTTGILEFQTSGDYKGFYNGEAVTVLSNQAGDQAYAFRCPDGFIEALAVPCRLQVSVTEPDWMENAQTYSYDLVFLVTVGNIVVHVDGSVTTNDAELSMKGTADMESAMIGDLSTWYTNPTVETIDFAG